MLGAWDAGGAWAEVRDARSLERVARLDGWDAVSARRLDGQQAMLASQAKQQRSQLAVLDPPTFGMARSWAVDASASWLGGP